MHIQSVDRALSILALFTYELPRLGVTEISRTLNLPKPTVHGLIQTMADAEFLVQDPETRKYSLGRKVYELGAVYSSSININRIGAVSVQELATRAGLSASLAVWENGSVMMTYRGATHYRNLQPRQLAPRIPAYCTSLGKAILAFLDAEVLAAYLESTTLAPYTQNTITAKEDLMENLRECRERGFAMDREEFIVGMSCVGAPVLDNTGYAVGAVSISGGGDQVFGKKHGRLTEELIETAMDISYKMGYLPRMQHSG